MGLAGLFWIYIFRIRILLFLTLVLLPILLLAHERRDTTIIRQGKKGDRPVSAQVYGLNDSTRMIFYKPKPFEFITNIPSDFAGLYQSTVRKDHLGKLALVLGSSALLIAFDQQITDAVHNFGNYIGVDPERVSNDIKIRIGNKRFPLIDIPQNFCTGLYFIGEGWPSIMLATGFFGYGLLKHDYRAQQTTSQMFEMFFTLALTVQTLKRLTGRESPFQRTQPGGTWRPFTNPAVYQKHVSVYDAMPSGHFATIMATITILAGNYPTNKWVKPVGYSLMGLCGLAMVHNGVHWMGDYPLAIAIGYTCGKVALARGHQVERRSRLGTLWGQNASLMPFAYGTHGVGLSYRCTF